MYLFLLIKIRNKILFETETENDLVFTVKLRFAAEQSE